MVRASCAVVYCRGSVHICIWSQRLKAYTAAFARLVPREDISDAPWFPLQEWQTDPFRMISKDGYLYGRGTSDNKGPVLAMIFAVKEFLDRHEGEQAGGLPVNLAFVFEGEEEIGSPGLEDAVKV